MREGTAKLYMQDSFDKEHLIMEMRQSTKNDSSFRGTAQGPHQAVPLP